MKILITGSTGLLGQALRRHLAQSCDVTGLSRSIPAGPAAERHVVCDLRDAQRTRAVIRELRPDVVIHAQALSDVDRCEQEPALANAMNAETVANLAQALDATRSTLVHLSTDYVFDGAKGSPYDELDAPHPISVYGRSKLEGERMALSYAASVVIRPSTLFGPGRMNFCDHVVARVKAGRTVEAFIDQVTSPTYTEDLAEGIGQLLGVIDRASITALPSRILHLANDGSCSRYEFAQRIAELLGASRAQIRAIRMAEQGRPAPRPPFSGLTTRYVPRLIGRRLRPWDEAFQAYLASTDRLHNIAPGAGSGWTGC
ncbi:MAG: dTDP-4-dehydrorhamnose reductase [Candidatus Omnitrophica bacterium]|nr:dTDP-4-dehydrorhamnose reductase [Candidatus Omnitrophota bacterium]MBI3022076.1 dTDP-4-dehydrorhamnose reductase [Candidatus Omnitrophota bacterium]